MRGLLVLSLSYLFSCTGELNAQGMINPDPGKLMGTTKPLTGTFTKAGISCNPPSSDLKWRPLLSPKFNESEPQEPNQEEFDRIKREKLLQRKNGARKNQFQNSEQSVQSVVPVVGVNYQGNTNNGWSPMDNCIAISDSGRIVSVANETIEYDDINGNTLHFNSLISLVHIADTSITSVCDPVVLYDPGADRFFFMCQSMPLDSLSRIFFFFSQSNDPGSTGWWIYEFNGDPTNSGLAFDYPKIGVSAHELFVTGNLFNEPSGSFNQAVLFQINKLAGYNGASLGTFFYYVGIAGSPFTLLPVSAGQATNYGPGIYLVSTGAVGGASVNLYQITNDLCCSPALNSWTVPTTPYFMSADASQLGTSCILKTGDCRSLSGFYLNNSGTGTIHFVFHSDMGTGYNGITYNRLNLNTLTNTSSQYGASGYDYCYPSVVSYSLSPADNGVMIGFARSGSSIYPEVRVVNCDNAMNWSASTLVKPSQSYVSYTSSTGERWGDYSGVCRRHNSTTPEIWMSGSFGTSTHVWSTWNAEIHNNIYAGIHEHEGAGLSAKVFPNPLVETFTVEFTLPESEVLQIGILDAQGKNVVSLYDGPAQPGDNVFSFNKANLAAGTYFLVIAHGDKVIDRKKIMVIR